MAALIAPAGAFFQQAGCGERFVEDAGAAFRNRPSLRLLRAREEREPKVREYVHVADREALAEATELMARYGDYATSEAAIRADRSRSVGNVLHFCRWRQIERTIEMLSAADVVGTVH
jgi:hypothetical protein